MTRTTTGTLITLAAVGMMLGLLGVEVAGLETWRDALTPTFIGTTMGHIATVIAAYVGGQIQPTNPRWQ